MIVSTVITKNNAEIEISKRENIFGRRKKVSNSELVYLGYYLFEIKSLVKGKTKVGYAGVDLISGQFAIMNLQNINYESDSKECIPKKYFSKDKAEQIVRKNVIYNSFSKPKIKSEDIKINFIGIIQYPYWIGYFKRKVGYDFDVIDAVNGKKQGAKMKSTFIKLILQ